MSTLVLNPSCELGSVTGAGGGPATAGGEALWTKRDLEYRRLTASIEPLSAERPLPSSDCPFVAADRRPRSPW